MIRSYSLTWNIIKRSFCLWNRSAIAPNVGLASIPTIGRIVYIVPTTTEENPS